MKKCPVCEIEVEGRKKYCSYACRNKYISTVRNYSSKEYKEKISKSLLKSYDIKKSKYTLIKVNCLECDNEISYYDHAKYKPKYCSRTCSNVGRWKNKEFKEKVGKNISESLILSDKNKKEISYKICPFCKDKFSLRRKYCSDLCVKESKLIRLSTRQLYHKKCQFSFSLNEYPDKFNFDLIKEYGWYKPKNHGDNLNGVSRDHIYSITDGFRNNIDPKIISHPANCQLLTHTDNLSKGKRSSITIEDLLERIKTF